MLSGFVIALTSRERVRSFSGYRDFLVRRLARIYPAYLAMHLVFALYVGSRVARGSPPLDRCSTDAASFVTHLLMIQAWTFPIGRGWNLVDWSVSAEWLVYLLFPAFAWVSRRREVWLVTAGAVLLFGGALADVGDSTNMELGLPRVLYGFVMGVAVHRLYVWRGAAGSGWGAIAVVVLAGAAYQASNPDAAFEPIAWAPLAFAGVVYALARSSWPVPRAMLWLGHVSYAVYLSHSLTLMLFEEAFGEPLGGAGLMYRLTYTAGQVVVVLAVGHLLYAGVERPARPRVMAWLRRSRG